MPREIAKNYEPQQIEPRWAEYWVKEALFKADANAPGLVFSVVIPPPNVTGVLHIGHMLDHTEIDILTRWHRMRGYNTLYLPGTDHAGISTQRVMVKQLADQGIDYRKLGRDEFEKRVWKWKEETGGTITRQMKQIGESCDWSREKFTLSPELSKVVIDVFVRLYEEGLIYRGYYMVNWCPSCLTTLSDLEVVHEERQGNLWHIRYPVVGSNDSLVVATTRPETMLGDTAVAVHPEDERYKQLVGKKALLPLMNREIPIIADEMVDREFGTGAVKITPAHDPNDFEVGKRHGLAEVNVMTDDAHVNANGGAYAGLDRFEARKKIVEDLKAQGLLVKTTEHTVPLGLCERCKTIVEPRALTQWFCKMKPLAEPAIAAVERGDIRIIPENWQAVYFHWMRNIRDWAISRQLWWGHRIPAWHCENGHVTVARETPAACGTCGAKNLTQDPDVLDTWFSSALWPFSTLGWPADTQDLRTYYPTSVLITGHEILFFWVARMAMMGIHFTGKVPFRDVYLHNIVKNAEGQKMSKSKGTGIDPIDINREFGTDAMRFTLALMAAPGSELIWTGDRIQSARNFANKIWNAARFLFVNLDKFEQSGATLQELAAPEVRAHAPYAHGGSVPLVDRWLYSRLAGTIETVNEALKSYRFHEAAQSVYDFFWGDFCDWYIEWVKPDLQSADRERAVVAWKNLFAAFDAALRLLHPLMPFLTEELWHQLPQKAGAKSIALGRFPEAETRWKDAEALREVAQIQEVVIRLRAMRAEQKLDAKKKLPAEFSTGSPGLRKLLEENSLVVKQLAVLSSLDIVSERLTGTGMVIHTATYGLRIPFEAIIDPSTEIARLKKEIERLEKDIRAKRSRLDDEDFTKKAPEHVVKNMGITMVERQLEQRKLKAQLEQLQGSQTAGT
jgi:valyl-tRNA synthetase